VNVDFIAPLPSVNGVKLADEYLFSISLALLLRITKQAKLSPPCGDHFAIFAVAPSQNPASFRDFDGFAPGIWFASQPMLCHKNNRKDSLMARAQVTPPGTIKPRSAE
jgi:hypothetical protein